MKNFSPQKPIVSLVCLAVLFSVVGCRDDSSTSDQAAAANRIRRQRRSVSETLLKTISDTLGDLPNQVDTELRPPQVILDATKSTNRKEVLATCKVNPQVPDGPFVYLEVPAGNANFHGLKVKAGDLVRYFVTYDQDSLEHGFEERTYLELIVRRLDSRNPRNALIVEGGLSGQVALPERIEIWRYSDKRMIDIHTRLQRYIKLRRPAVGWEPSPDENVLAQLVDRLNQWVRNQTTAVDTWQYDPLLEKLPQELREAKPLAETLSQESLRDAVFDENEGRLLQQAVWARDISAWAKGDNLSDLEIASALFDWTVRNIQLDPAGISEKTDGIHHPWQALMYGHGNAEQRAWVFAELCRQQQLDVVMLAIRPQSDALPQWWLPALLSQGKLYLFDTQLGLPIPGPKGSEVATLAEVVADASLLRQLDLGEEEKYWVDAESLQHVEAWLVASPEQLSRRWSLLESVLEGDDFVVLTSGHERFAEELANHPHLAGTRFWPLPFESRVQQLKIKPTSRQRAAKRFEIFARIPRLWKARVLHFQGTKQIPASQRNDPLAEPRLGHRDATKFYQDERVRPPERILGKLEPAKQEVYRATKADATYWLGLLKFDQQNYKVSADWMQMLRALKGSSEGPWGEGTSYNLARAYEAIGELDQAIALLEENTSPQSHGNRLRARRLKQRVEELSESR